VRPNPPRSKPDRGDPSASKTAFRRLGDEPTVAPTLLWFEPQNVRLTGSIAPSPRDSRALGFLKDIGELPIAVDDDPCEGVVLWRSLTGRRFSPPDICDWRKELAWRCRP